MKRKFDLQLFEAPAGMTGSENLDVRAREIDFVTSFSKNMQAFLDILGISRLIKKENNSELYVKTVTGTLESGDVAPGEQIPYSEFFVETHPVGKIKIEKYAKGVPIEAIAEKGYEIAITDTDEEMKTQLQGKVTDKFYAMLNGGTLNGYASTFQAALAKAIGLAVGKFQEMERTATGLVGFVNTYDFYDYLGEKDITVQTLFGMQYVKDFLGINTLFLTVRVPSKHIIVTPLNNLVGYYVDPGDSEFSRAGLPFTVDPSTRFIGFHTQGDYKTAISEMFALMGITVMAEYQDAIADVEVGGSSTKTIGTLKLTATEGEETGTTHISIAEPMMAINNRYKIKVDASQESVSLGTDVKTWKKWDGVSDIPAEASQVVTVVECDQNYKAVATGYVTVAVKE